MSSGSVRERSVESGPVRIRVYERGRREARPLVLVHGIQDFAASLDSLAEALARDFLVTTYDLRGHGDSDKPGSYTMTHHLADLHRVVEPWKEQRPVLVGHSLGGQIVSHYAGLFSNVPACIVSIEGLGPPVRPADMPVDWRREQARRGVESLLRPSSVGRAIHDPDHALQMYRKTHPRLDRAEAARLARLATESHPEGGLRWKWDPRVQTTWLSVTPEVSEERWTWITCPVLQVTAGRATEFWRKRRSVDVENRADPAELARRLALFRDLEHVEIASAGHMVHYDAPEELAEVVKSFLRATALEDGGERTEVDEDVA